MVVPGALGGEGIVTLCSCLAFLAAFIAILGSQSFKGRIVLYLAGIGLIFTLIDLGLRLCGLGGFSFFRLQLSPYKNLSYLLQQPGALVEFSQRNAISRVDVFSSPQIHSFPGLSYRYLEPLPSQKGLLVDGDDLSPLLSENANMQFSAYLPDATTL